MFPLPADDFKIFLYELDPKLLIISTHRQTILCWIIFNFPSDTAKNIIKNCKLEISENEK